MSLMLRIFAGLAMLAGFLILGSAKSAIHEIEAFILFLISAVLLSGGETVDKLSILISKIDHGPNEKQESTGKKCPSCAELVKLEALKCRFCGETFDPDVVKTQIEEHHASLEREAKRKGLLQCPRCGSVDVHYAYIEDGGWGHWCPHCQMSLQRMKDLAGKG